MCTTAFVVGLILILFTAVVYLFKRSKTEDGKVTFGVFGQTFSGTMLGAFLVVGLILTLASLAQAKHEESQASELAQEADTLVTQAKEGGAAQHAPDAFRKVTEAKGELDKEIATQSSKLPMFRSYARAKSLAEDTKASAGSLQEVLRARGVLTPSSGSLQDQIRRVYHDVLDRAPLTWEVDVWLNNINSGKETIASMRRAFASDPQCDAAITTAYQAVLHRGPSPEEVTTARIQLASGASIASIRRRLAGPG